MACDRDWGKFWKKYGDFKSASALIKGLRHDRTSLDKEDANKAKEESDFTHYYRTRNEGDRRRLVMQKDSDIARRWRERHGLEARWWHSFI